MIRAFLTAILFVIATDLAVRLAWGGSPPRTLSLTPALIGEVFMKKFPTRLKIGEHEYRIVLMDELEDEKAGMCFYGPEKVIMVSARQSKDEIVATLIHEILHAIEAEHKVTLGHGIINKLEYALAEVFGQLLALQSKR